ncbi:MAG: fused MFS/spermidine synthase, partial [Verrucomicrobiae bacterium]|nr:fused MFS/spermidine synthase [Verrucomicrobiae bacterium]
SPSVWTTCMLFFQVLLVGGYGYAHFVSRKLSARNFAILHFALLGVALFFLPITPSESWKPLAGEDPTAHLLLLLLLTIGLPYLLLSASSPILQWWFHMQHEKTPYRLFALSNVGSLLGLISYPFLVEPIFTVRHQSGFWSIVFILYTICLAWCGVIFLKNPKNEAFQAGSNTRNKEATNPTVSTPTSFHDWISWIFLPGIASLLLLAITNQISQNISVVPFLWILPLSLYLISFILCFSRDRQYTRVLWVPIFLVSASAVLYARILGMPIILQVAAYCTLLFSACMLCHGELARIKPPPEKLTLYFFLISIGGALGGFCVSIIAPLVFNDYWELHFGIVFTSLLVGYFFLSGRKRSKGFLNLLPVASWFAVTLLVGFFLWSDVSDRTRSSIEQSRNFYGTLKVTAENTGLVTEKHILFHGDIVHGMQYTDERRQNYPTTYYSLESGLNYAIRRHPKRSAREADPRHFTPMRIGIVGLGVGTIAAYGLPEDVFRFYEIDPDVKTVADTHFTYLRNSLAQLEFAIGDARTLLASQDPQDFDVLIVDAFSGDAVPVHLITFEAFQLYLSHLNETGVLAFHISNKFLDLKPLILGLTRQAKRTIGWIRSKEDNTRGAFEADWIIVAKDPSYFDDKLVQAALRPFPEYPELIVWTDDFSNLLDVLP